MDSQTIKNKLISWLSSLEDEELINRVNELIEQAKAEDFNTTFSPLTLIEMQSRLNEGLEDAEKGNVISHEDLKKGK